MYVSIEQGVECLLARDLLAFPTETVYGLGAIARSPEAVAKIYATKGRPLNHPVIVHIASVEELERWAKDIPSHAYTLAKRFWPGPLSMVLTKASWVGDYLTGGQDSIALRCPNHPIALDILHHVGDGIAAPSANRFGRISPTRAEHVLADFGDGLAIIDGGNSVIGLESSIVDIRDNSARMLRPGAITASDIAAQGIPLAAEEATRESLRVSGALKSHYAPNKACYVAAFSTAKALKRFIDEQGLQNVGLLSYQPELSQDAAAELASVKTSYIVPQDARAYATELYHALRSLDSCVNIDSIVVQDVPSEHGFRAIRDRLTKASAKGD